MKKVLRIACSFAGAALLFASCQKEAVDKTDPKISDGEVLITVNASEGAETKTYIDGTAVKWADTGEFIRVYEVATPKGEGNDVTSAKDSAEGATTDEGASMTFGVSMATKSTEDYGSFAYYAFYPASAHNSSTSADHVLINTTANQKPTATSFDPKADLLIAKSQTANSQPGTLNMQFARGVAVAKMTIKNLETTDPVTKVTFSAKLGSEPINLAGRTAFNLTNATLVSTFASNVKETSIVIDCANITQEANTADGTPIFFTSYPFVLNSTTPGSFKVVVETATQSFEKEITVGSGTNSDRSLVFKTGKASVFSVNMDGIAGETKAVDLRYAYLDYEDFTSHGGTSSYGNVTADKTHGDSWVMYAIGTNNAIGVRRNDNGQNDSYIKLPDFKENIKTVVVTMKNVTASKTITLETSATASSGSIASLATTDATVYTFDLTSESVKTAFFRSSGFQAQVEKIEVYAGEDNRTAFAAPATVSAELNDDDAEVTNSIDVSWSSVDGASGYVITLTPDTGDDVVVKTASSPYTVTNLEHEMDYLVSVQAEPADYYVNTISAMTTFADVVTTGAAAAGYVTLTDSDITTGANTVKGTNNGLLAYRMGTGSNDGSLTFGAGYESITFTLAGFASGTRAFSITNGKINNSTSLSPAAGTPSGTINANFSTSYSGTEYTIIVDDPEQEVVFSGRRAVVWGFTAIEAAPDTRADVTLSFAEDEFEFVVDSDEYNNFTPQTATASPNVAAITNAITYALSDPNGVVSGFSTSTGSFTLTGETGTATITASYAGDTDNYKPADDVSYTVKVTSGTTKSAVTITMSEAGFENAADMTEFTVDGVVVTPGSGVKYYTSGASARIYANNTFKISCTEAPITSMEFTYSQGAFVQDSFDTGTYSSGTWTGSANEINMTNGTGAQVRISTIVVYFD